MNLFPRDKQHIPNMIFVFGYMSGQQINSMINDWGGFNMDVTTYTMILVVKLWGLGWAYRDGGMKDDKLTKD